MLLINKKNTLLFTRSSTQFDPDSVIDLQMAMSSSNHIISELCVLVWKTSQLLDRTGNCFTSLPLLRHAVGTQTESELRN